MSVPPPPAPPPPSALPPPAGPRRVRRLTRWPVVIGASAIILPAAAAIWAVTHTGERGSGAIDQDIGSSTMAANAAPALQHAGDGAIQPAVVRTPVPSATPPVAPATSAPPPAPRKGESDVTRKMRAEAWAAYYKAVASDKERRQAERVAALTGDTIAAQPAAASAGAQGAGAAQGGGGAVFAARGAYGGDLGSGGGAGGNGQNGGSYFGAHGPSDPASDYSPYTLTEPLSDYEVKAGDVITGTMAGGANSDTPGEIVGLVSKPVFDYKTGTHVLIPQGTRIIGSYNTNMSYGQDRLEVGLERLIYPRPCAQSLDLGRMAGSDISGNAGFSDQTDNHYGKQFVKALLLAGISAGVQLSQPQQTTFGYPSTSQVAAGALGQQLGQLGIESARRGMDIPPTQRIRNGYPFVLKLEKDIPFAEGYTCPEAGWVDGRPAPTSLDASYGR